MTINPGEKSKYKNTMSKEMEEGTNRPLDDIEIIQQIKDILLHVNPT
jgi:hypothetical protein